ncbi:putative vinorine synthase [Tanacetum coccineum]
MGEADVIFCIRIKREDKGITITQSHYIEKILKKFKYDDCCTPLDLTIKLMPNTCRAVDQLEYFRAISWLITGWVFLLGGGAISWASKKQTYITDSTMGEKFVAFAATNKEAEWLRNLIYEITLWPKPISLISIYCDNVTTFAKAYCQIYNGKSRHLDQWPYTSLAQDELGGAECIHVTVSLIPPRQKCGGQGGRAPLLIAASTTAVIKNLKESLSQILTRFYPIAGEVKNNLHIECNDKGVNFIEARVNQSLKEFLHQPHDEKVRELVPNSPRTGESSIGNYVIGVQVNTFNCGGIGLSMSAPHKIFDGHTYFLFRKAWAAAARGSPERMSQSFVASQVFPNNPKYSWPSKFTNTESVITKRFLFNSAAIASLKAQPVSCTGVSAPRSGPTRMEATSSLIWKVVAKASSVVRSFGPQSPHALFSFVNFRKRASPPIPYNSIGNLVRTATAICFPESQPDLPTLMGEIRESIAKINSDHIESIKGEKGQKEFNQILRSLKDLTDVTEDGDNCLFVTSILNSGMYELDFGWGKPIWYYDMNAGFSRIVALNDTLKAGSVEATLTLKCDEMEIFEHDHELLSYATVDPSPLNFNDHST